MLDNFDALQDAFSMKEGLKVVADAKFISMNELGQHFWTGKQAILVAMKEDAKNTAADTDTSSYRIDIGV